MTQEEKLIELFSCIEKSLPKHIELSEYGKQKAAEAIAEHKRITEFLYSGENL